MKLPNLSWQKLCPPAKLYLALSLLSLVAILFSRQWNINAFTFSLGGVSPSIINGIITLVSQLVYIGFWTYVLNLMCKDGQSLISWILVVLPFILLVMMSFMSPF